MFRHRLSGFQISTGSLVSGIDQTIMDAPQLDFRAGVVAFVSDDGYRRLADMETEWLFGSHVAAFRFSAAAYFERPLVMALFWETPDRRRLFGYHSFMDSDPDNDDLILAPATISRDVAASLSTLGQLCFDLEFCLVEIECIAKTVVSVIMGTPQLAVG